MPAVQNDAAARSGGLAQEAVVDASADGRGRDRKQLYLATNAGGVRVYTKEGAFVRAFATGTGASEVALDDAGNAYVGYGTGDALRIARYALGADKPSALYVPEKAPSNFHGGFLLASPDGSEVAFAGYAASAPGATVYEVWDHGKTGAPSRVFTYSNNSYLALTMDRAGTLYVAYLDGASQTMRYDVYPSGASRPSRTIVDTLLTPSEAANFAVNWLAVADDGTLYAAEYSYIAGDPLAGLYVYPSHGAERIVTAGASSPAALGLDASGRVYVVNTNWVYSPAFACDTLHTLSVFSRGAKTLLSQATSGFENGQELTVDANGTAYIDAFPYNPPLPACANVQGAGALAQVLPGANSGSEIITGEPNQDVAIYDGRQGINPTMQPR
jgi:hypothetical protein